jgi:Putative zinc dependent peptidase (DUF5700)
MRRLAIAVLLVITTAAVADNRIDLKLDTSEADAVLAILRTAHPTDADWQRLITSEPYIRLKAREASLRRDFTDDEFKRYVLSPDLKARAEKLRTTLTAWKKANLRAAAERALTYLPVDARIKASVYPSIKPRQNSFVWEMTTNPAVFLYLDPDISPAQFENTVAHELHHIGLASLTAEYERRIEPLAPNPHKAAEWMGALGEGVAMLAAAGSPDVDPVAAFGKADQIRWRQDMTGWDIRLMELDQFFADIVEGGFTKPEIVDHVAATFFGYRGQWYQVGYKMAVTIEKELGRPALIATMADPRDFLARYNEAAARINARGQQKLPLFRASVLKAVGK